MKILNLPSLILLFNLIATNVSAQLTKGSTWLGGSLGYASSKSESPYSEKLKTHTFAFNPAIGKVVKPNLIVGVELNYVYHDEVRTNVFNNDDKIHTGDYGGGVFVRKYVETIKKVYLFAHAGIGGSLGRDKTDNLYAPDIETKSWQAGLSLYPGVSYALNPKVFLEAVFTNLFTVGYSNSKTSGTNNAENKSSSFAAAANFNVANNFGIGVRFVLPGKSK